MCFDWNSSGDHSVIGEFHTNLKGLLVPDVTFKCINRKKKVKLNSKLLLYFFYDNTLLIYSNTVRKKKKTM